MEKEHLILFTISKYDISMRSSSNSCAFALHALSVLSV